MERQPAVADRFYPGNPTQLSRTVASLIPDLPTEKKLQAKAVIVPHAGYIYSGATAGKTFSRVHVPDTAVVLGPNHHGMGEMLALGMQDWQMPMGKVPLNRELADLVIAQSATIKADDTAHIHEHSLEVQVPFLQSLQGALSIVPICVSHVSYDLCTVAAEDLASAILKFAKPVILVASTDMTHYKSRTVAGRQDSLAIDHILQMDARGLYDTVHREGITMCGVVPTTITLLTAQKLGAKKVELVQYTDSGEASGDTDQVVGYAGLVVS